MMQKWKFWCVHNGGEPRMGETYCEMTATQFLSCMAWWNGPSMNPGHTYFYWPDWNQPGIVSKHMCRNIEQ